MKGRPFSVGGTLQELKIHSTDQDWKHIFVCDVGEAIMYKVLSLNHLDWYFDTNSTLINWEDTKVFCTTMRDMIRSEKSSVSGEIRARIQHGKLDLSREHANLEVIIKEVNGALDVHQFCAANDWMRWITLWQRKLGNVVPRPESDNPMDWWKFAFSSVIDEVGKKLASWKWTNIKKHGMRRDQYISFYLKSLTDDLGPAEEQVFETIHRQESYDDILSWRKLANAKKKKITDIGRIKTNVCSN